MPEVELKLAAPPKFRLPDLSGLGEGIDPVSFPPAQLRTTYWDTPDLRLVRWGCSLRHRGGEGWTVKLPGQVSDGLLSRPEVTFDGPPVRPPAGAVGLLRAFVRDDRVEPVTRLRTLRRRIDLVGDSAGPAAMVTLDDVAVMDGRRVAHRFREIEVELAGEHPDGLLDAVRGRLAVAGAGDPDPTPKLVRALGDRARDQPEIPTTEPGPDASTREVMGAAFAASVRRLLLHDPGFRLGQDAEAVHQCRVATRRLRSDLRTFRPYLQAERTEPLREELRWLGRALGPPRDTDVLLARLRRIAEAFPGDDRAAAGLLLGRLEPERAEARSALQATLNEDRYVTLVKDLVDLTRDLPLTGGGDRPGAEALPGLVRGPWDRLRKAMVALGTRPSDHELHRIRIRTKRCRYAAEAVSPVVGKNAVAFAKAATTLQDVLGDHQDAVVADEWLRGAARKAGGRQAFAAGLLVAGLMDQRAATGESLPRAWNRMKRKRPERWA